MSTYPQYQEGVNRTDPPATYYDASNASAVRGTTTSQKPPAMKDRFGKREISSRTSMLLSAMILCLGFYCYPILLLNAFFLRSNNGAARVLAGCSVCLCFVFLSLIILAVLYPIIAGSVLGGVFGSRANNPTPM